MLKRFLVRSFSSRLSYPFKKDYPAPTHTVQSFRSSFTSLLAGARQTDSPCVLVGRIASIRESSSKLVFYSLSAPLDPTVSLQIMADAQYYDAVHGPFSEAVQNVKRGDYVCIEGFPGKSQKGELSIFPRKVTVLAPCLHSLPSHDGLADPNLRYRNRHLDMIVDGRRVVKAIEARNHVYGVIRRVLSQNGFTEVETPMLQWLAGGANARPFKTAMDSFGRDHLQMELRIAPELFLKQLVIGGLERVFELGRQFRNEGADATHNPEFTTCEFYGAHLDADDMASLAETIVCQILGWPATRRPFPRLSFVDTIEQETKDLMPADLSDEDAIRQFCSKHHALPSSKPYTVSRCLDSLAEKFIEPLCDPEFCTFIVDHPIALSPLAREHPDLTKRKRGLSHRFELFLARKEIANGYSELNRPDEQKLRFDAQKEQQKKGDAEARTGADEDFVKALEFGLPPTGGCGLGIDRLVMSLCQEKHIRDVLLFPLMRPQA
ncbi:mitochondrial lysyl-tRNA synthetase (LysRS) [Andalucia godoyi]|uniref:Lysyl-tRNA synthetase n=1 Tax=Andalucia godoyi TaxID=505711 RepID=A0A8K0AJX5_ANDGO|nr:mitochondrial lysyl-tRNA synthetase (LysRS) [Andalucia godoyi]|eukprot:ANDGO_00601.mRNA.1 mitochondrial lysyl-tRNA synthetase (LysRS)